MKLYNKVKTLVVLSAAALTLAACGDFLEIKPRTFVSEDNFWNEKTDVDQMVTGVYTSLQSSGIIERCIMWGETRSDNVTGGLNYDKNQNVYRTLKENLLSTNRYTSWLDFYSVINKCNVIINMAPVVSEQDPVYNKSNVKATVAEMKFIRSLCYFYLVRAFKDVPYTTEGFIDEKGGEPRAASKGDSIVRVLIADLEGCVGDALTAYPKDESSKYNSNCNRVTRAAIYALLSDLCLWDNQYDKTIDYAQRVIDAKVKEYETDYSKQTAFTGSNPALFQYANNNYVGEQYPLYPCCSGNSWGSSFDAIFGQENSFESLFELNFSYDGSDGNYIAADGIASLYGRYSADSKDGYGVLGVPENTMTDLTQKTFKVYTSDKDVRYYADIAPTDNQFTKGYIAKGVAGGANISEAQGSEKGALKYKTVFDKTNIHANRNWIFYRLTDIMLLQAEALVESAGENVTLEDGSLDERLAKAFAIVWVINRRSIMETSATATSPEALNITNYKTKADMRELVMQERRRELMFEGKRWFDIVRRCHREGKPDFARYNVPAKISTGGNATLFVNYEALFWPYNKDEVKINTLLSQKPFYGNDSDEDSFKSTK